eukprot:COSAG04_NODE_1625_length_6126_cov_7.367679_8_plen_60_part_01
MNFRALLKALMPSPDGSWRAARERDERSDQICEGHTEDQPRQDGQLAGGDLMQGAIVGGI